MAYQMDFFAGVEEKVLAAIGTKVKYPAYVFIRDNEESVTGRLAFVDQNNTLKYIRGENKQHVVNINELPSVDKGDVEVLYIMNGIVYVFDGTEYKPINNEPSAELDSLTEKLDGLTEQVGTLEEKVNEFETKVGELDGLKEKVNEFETKIGNLETKAEELEAKDVTLAEQIEALRKQIEAIEIPEECDCGDKYEVADAPIGTLVDYRDEEIRIMCPSDAVFTKQAVGTGGDPNSYYVTFKTYVPNDDVAGYIEHLNGQVDDEILTTFSTNEDGRRYQPTWLAIAKYDENTGVWNYYGKNSTKDKYIGWNYQIDWYNSEGVIISSDCIRINLSNEECHYIIEPYYLTGIKTQINDVVEQLGTVTEQLIEYEDRIVEVEKATLTFVELE